MENQDKGTGPTFWYPAFPATGLPLEKAEEYMANLGPRFADTGKCSYCMKEVGSH